MHVVREAIKPDPMPEMYNYDNGTYVAIIAAGDEDNRHVVMYPCRAHEQMNVACAVADSSLSKPANLEYSWNAKGSVDELVDGIRGFPEWIRRVFRYVMFMNQLASSDMLTQICNQAYAQRRSLPST